MPTQAPTQTIREQATPLMDAHITSWKSLLSKLTGLQDYTPNPTDVFACSFMKSGTTLMQQLIYQLFVATGRVPTDPNGDNYKDLSEVVPLIEARHGTGVHASIHDYSPRVWKCHLKPGVFESDDVLRKSCKYVYCYREGRNVIRSYADFTVDWLAESPIEGEELRNEMYRQAWMRCFLGIEEGEDGSVVDLGGAVHDWFGHVKTWLDTNLENVLFVPYDGLVKDMNGWVRRVARFLDVQVNDEQAAFVTKRCSKEFMANDPRSNSRLISDMMGWRMDLGVRARLENDRSFKGVVLPEICYKEFDRKFIETFGEGGWPAVASAADKRNEEAGI